MGFINQFPYSDFHELNLDWLIKQTRLLQDQVKTLQEQIAEIEVMTEEQILAMINTAISTNNIELYNKMAELKAQITNEYTAYIALQISALKTYLDNQDVFYDNLAKSYADNALIQAKNYTDQSVLDYTMMVNPINGNYEDVRKVVNDIFSTFLTNESLTAAEYDVLELTAEDYDTKDLTAYDYDFNGKNLLP